MLRAPGSRIEERVPPRRDSQLSLLVKRCERHSKQGQTPCPAWVHSDWQERPQMGPCLTVRELGLGLGLSGRSQKAIRRFICCSDFHLNFFVLASTYSGNTESVCFCQTSVMFENSVSSPLALSSLGCWSRSFHLPF